MLRYQLLFDVSWVSSYISSDHCPGGQECTDDRNLQSDEFAPFSKKTFEKESPQQLFLMSVILQTPELGSIML